MFATPLSRPFELSQVETDRYWESVDANHGLTRPASEASVSTRNLPALPAALSAKRSNQSAQESATKRPRFVLRTYGAAADSPPHDVDATPGAVPVSRLKSWNVNEVRHVQDELRQLKPASLAATIKELDVKAELAGKLPVASAIVFPDSRRVHQLGDPDPMFGSTSATRRRKLLDFLTYGVSSTRQINAFEGWQVPQGLKKAAIR